MNDSRAHQVSNTHDAVESERQIRALVEHIRAMQRRIEAFTAEIQQSKEELRPLLERLGTNWADERGYARLVSEGLQRFYDADALDKLILSDPMHYGWLKDYRRERVLSERIHIR